MSPPVLHLPLDLTGDAVTNRVTAELHPIAASGNRAVVTQRGPFFTKNLVVRNANTGQTLVPDQDYRPVHMFLEASLRATLEICSVVLVLPACNATEIEIDYSAIGGEYSASVTSIEQMIESLDLDNRTVHWGDLLGAPEYFHPTAHLHDIGDLYGFEYVVAALEGVRRAILMGDQAAFDELRRYIDLQDNELRNLIQSGQGQIEEHINRTDNPHNTTKVHVGLGNVQNYGVATQAQAQAATANNVYMTPLRTREAVQSLVGDTINAHVANMNNPHQVTKAQVGLGNVENLGIASVSQAMAGSGQAYMTATLTGTAINNLAVSPMNAHIGRTDNPHNVTKTQVGLGSVVNYAIATTAQAQAGSGNAYMTATLTGAAITALALTPLNIHVARTDNPHSVTKAQVGLGSVQNYGIASNAQAIAGTATNVYMTPANTRAAIDSLVGNVLNSHTSRTDNPHQVTKTQVGLGNVDNVAQVRAGTTNTYVITWNGSIARLYIDGTNIGQIFTASTPDPNIAAHANRTDNPHNTTAAQVGLGNVYNYGIATQAEAEAGSVNTEYMTPLRTAQAINSRAVNPLTALINQRVVTGSNAALNSLTIGSSGYLYQDGSHVSLRVNGNRYYRFGSDGNFNVLNGRVIAASGFQPSDRRLKDSITDAEARPLWRSVPFKRFRMIETGEFQSGVIAQRMQKIAPDRVYEYEHSSGKRKVKRLSVDYTGAGFEMAMAAGQEVDRLHEKVAVQEALIAKLMARLDALEEKR